MRRAVLGLEMFQHFVSGDSASQASMGASGSDGEQLRPRTFLEWAGERPDCIVGRLGVDEQVSRQVALQLLIRLASGHCLEVDEQVSRQVALQLLHRPRPTSEGIG